MQAHSVGMFRAKSAICEALKAVYGDRLKAVYDKSSGTAPFKAGLELVDGYLWKADGYVASDIAYVVNEAATIAAFNHEDITQELLIKTIEGIKPSVNKELLKEYEEMRDKMEGISRTNSLPRVGFNPVNS
jgi:SpoVK/Ycf46/Vps4 family AAA+-type ATPase